MVVVWILSSFWHQINQEPNETWHPLFKQALTVIRQYIKP
jgi:hypothetical protein